MDLGRYSKLIGSFTGSAVAIILAWMAVQFPSIAQCTVGPDGTDACVVLGFTQVQITAALMAVLNMVFVYSFPANRPPA